MSRVAVLAAVLLFVYAAMSEAGAGRAALALCAGFGFVGALIIGLMRDA